MSTYRLLRARWFGEVERHPGEICTDAEFVAEGWTAENVDAFVHNRIIELVDNADRVQLAPSSAASGELAQLEGESSTHFALRLLATMGSARAPAAAPASTPVAAPSRALTLAASSASRDLGDEIAERLFSSAAVVPAAPLASGGAPVQRDGESATAFAGRLLEHMRASAVPVAGAPLRRMDAELSLALQAGDAIDSRKAAAAQAERGRLAVPRPAAGAHVTDPGRHHWVQP